MNVFLFPTDTRHGIVDQLTFFLMIFKDEQGKSTNINFRGPKSTFNRFIIRLFYYKNIISITKKTIYCILMYNFSIDIYI